MVPRGGTRFARSTYGHSNNPASTLRMLAFFHIARIYLQAKLMPVVFRCAHSTRSLSRQLLRYTQVIFLSVNTAINRDCHTKKQPLFASKRGCLESGAGGRTRTDTEG